MRYRNCELLLRRSFVPIAAQSPKEEITPKLIHKGIPQELLDTIPNPAADNQAIVVVIKPWGYLSLRQLFTLSLKSNQNYWVHRLGDGFARADRRWLVRYWRAYISDLWGVTEDLFVAPFFLVSLLVKTSLKRFKSK